jgi:peptide/nickel transport system substrate-binding protein
MAAAVGRRFRITRRRVLGLGAGTGAAAFLAACGGDSKKESGTPANNAAVPQASATSAAQAQAQGATAKPGGTLRYHIPKEPGNLDPHLATDSSTTAFSNLVYNSMLRFKTGVHVDTLSTEVEGDLAQSWETPDTSTVTLKLRPGVTWQNKPPLNGRAFTAEDAKWGILRIGTKDPAFQRRTFFEGIDRIDTPDATTLVIKQKAPNVPFLTYLAVPYHKIISRDVIEKEGDAKTTMIGTGPFTLESYAKGTKAVFKKNPDYYKKGQGLPYLDGIELAGVIEPAARVAAFRAGETDIIRFEQPTDLEPVKSSVSGVLSDTYVPMYYSMPFGFDVTRGPYQDVRVRQAMALVIDHPGLRRALFKDLAVRMPPIPAGFKEWVADPKDLEFYGDKPDLQKAKDLMKAAGMEGGFKAVMDTNTSYTNQIDAMPYLRDMLKQINIDVTELKKVDPTAFLGPTNVPGGFEMRLWNHSAFSEPDEFVSNFYQRGASRNFGGWGNEQVDKLIEQQRNIANKEERKKVLIEIQKILARENWRIGLEQWYEPVAWYPKVKGWRALAADPGYQTLPMEGAWLDR